MHAHLRIPRFIMQPMVALILISAMLLVGLVASSAPVRAAVAQGISTISTAISQDVTHTSAGHPLAVSPQPLCIVSGIGCP